PSPGPPAGADSPQRTRRSASTPERTPEPAPGTSGEVRRFRSGQYGVLCRSLDDPVLIGVRRGCRPGRQVELREDVAQVSSDRLLAEDEVSGDGTIRSAGRHQPEHLDLTSGQTADRPHPALAGQRVDAGKVRRRAKLLEDAPR